MGKQEPTTSSTMGKPTSSSDAGTSTTVLLVTAAAASGGALAAACRRRGSAVEVVEPNGRPNGDPDVLLLDLTTDASRVLRFAGEVLDCGPARVVVISGEPAAVVTSFAVEAWVDLDTPLEQLDEVIHGRASARSVAPPASGRRGRGHDLTPREREVLVELLVAGDAQDTAARLGISTHTVRTHIQNILDKLGVRTRAEAAAWALREGLVPASSSGGQAS
jgi:DNA-binding CsgD family transcriptional regulator